jgi:hypothetical protein
MALFKLLIYSTVGDESRKFSSLNHTWISQTSTWLGRVNRSNELPFLLNLLDFMMAVMSSKSTATCYDTPWSLLVPAPHRTSGKISMGVLSEACCGLEHSEIDGFLGSVSLTARLPHLS